ncbi:MAG: polysaccharide deacetylase family protein [Clostridiales bacterium]|nr:polysaccharide deacetylase family protein [Clostridiales bacterium]
MKNNRVLTEPERRARREHKQKVRRRQLRRRTLASALLLLLCLVGGMAAASVWRRSEEAALVQERQEADESGTELIIDPWSETDLPDIRAIYGISVNETGWSHFFADNSYAMAPVDHYVTAMRCTLQNQPQGMTGTVTYQVNLSGSGWLDWREDGTEAGASSGDTPLEAVAMKLTGQLGEHYDILYSVLQNQAWTDWVKNGEEAGVSGQGMRVDGIRISVVERQKGRESYAGNIDPTRPMVALTFDDGPSASATLRILNALAEQNGRATFFMVGRQVAKYPDVVRQVAESGSEIGNHTYDHVAMTKEDPGELANQLARNSQAISEICGIAPVLMRPVGGAESEEGMSMVGAVSMPAVLWSVDTLDWKTRDAQSTIAEVLDKVQDGDIILMHDLYDATAEAAETLIPELTSQGYQLVTVSELASYRGGMLPGKSYGKFRPTQ